MQRPEVELALAEVSLGAPWRIFLREQSASTMDDARALVQGGGAEWLALELARRSCCFSCEPPLAVIAGEQSAGRGRSGRIWSSAPGAGLYATFVVFPDHPDFFQALSLLVGVAVRRALAGWGVAARLKWPNDIVICGESSRGFEKISGVLIERYEAGGRTVCSIGVGINVFKDGAAASVGGTSIEDQGVHVSRGRLLARLLSELERMFKSAAEGGRRELLAEWERFSVMRGAVVHREQDQAQWRVRGVDDLGGLLVYSCDDDQREETIYGGEVVVLHALGN